MPPTITEKRNLGNLFGGKIASINYNFQIGSEASTSTLTLVSENNSFSIPSWNELVSIPPFGFSMSVIEHSIKDNSDYKSLQVELIDSLSNILDKELVLIYGEHTDPNYHLNNDLYEIYKSVYIGKRYYPASSVFNPNIEFPNLRKDYVKNHGGGINIIGMPRATYLEETSVNITGSSKLKAEPEWYSFDAGVLNTSISSFKNNFIYTPDKSSSVNLTYGYTLRNLLLLFSSKGVTFEGGSARIMLDETLLFSETGTMRSVLTSCLSKIGRSFYVDPFTQKIKIISNNDISRINSNLLNNFSNFSSITGAKQISLTQSIRDVTSTHFIVKGDLEYKDANKERLERNSNRSMKQVLYKLNVKDLFGDLEKGDIELIKRVAPLLFLTNDTETLDTYLYALGLVHDPKNWGILYNSEFYTPGEFLPVAKKSLVRGGEPNRARWQKFITDEFIAGESEDFKFYELNKTVGARQLFSGESKLASKSGSDVNYYDNVKNFMLLWGGVYFSAPISERAIERRNYQEQAKWLLGLDNSFEFVFVNGESFISEVPELNFVVQLLKRIGAKINIKVKDVAAKAYKSAIGDGDYFILGIRRMFLGSGFDSEDAVRNINSSFLHIYDAELKDRYLLYNAEALNVIKKIEKQSIEAFAKESEKVKDRLVVRYTPTESDRDPSGDSQQEEIHDVPTVASIQHIFSNIQNYSSKDFFVFQDRLEEVDLFLRNLGSINPEFSGPFITTDIDYYRPPLKSDFDVEKGVDSISISLTDKGVSTSIKYSSKKFANIDTSLIRDMFGSRSTSQSKRISRRAFERNRNNS